MRKEWAEKTLGECCIGRPAYGANAPSVDYDLNLPRYLRITDISEDGNLIASDPRSINEKDAKGNYLNRGDIVFARSGATAGKTYLHQSDDILAYAGYLIRFRPDASVILPEYLFLYTRSDHYKTWVKNNIRAGAQPNINAQEYSSINILLPPIAEQKKISAILRTWDDAIEKLERLIILNDQKLDHLIQNLIFGIVRVEQSVTNERIKDKWISGPKDWSLIKIGDIASEKSKLNSDGKNHVVLSCSKHDGFVRSLEYFKKQIFSKDLKSYKIINRGDFGFPSNHVEEGSIGLQNLEDTAVVSPIYIIFTPDKKKIDSSFLYRLLKTRTYADIFRASTSSSVDRRGNLRWNEFAKILLFLPPLREQKQIATIIETQQVLIEKLKQHKELLISQKRGLMQKLLTGVWPVQADSSEESSNKKEKKHA